MPTTSNCTSPTFRSARAVKHTKCAAGLSLSPGAPRDHHQYHRERERVCACLGTNKASGVVETGAPDRGSGPVLPYRVLAEQAVALSERATRSGSYAVELSGK